ncbi:hypothetical protein [Propioniciclava tarda]|nr:hypothetical protein [Propioniciclava tarda]SMO31878.1 hypothetical protein SAMN06266982_10120 [Propioniciclava tarda]
MRKPNRFEAIATGLTAAMALSLGGCATHAAETPKAPITATATPDKPVDTPQSHAAYDKYKALSLAEFEKLPRSEQLTFTYEATRTGTFAVPPTKTLGRGFSQLPEYDLFATSDESTSDQKVLDSLWDALNAAQTAANDDMSPNNELGQKILASLSTMTDRSEGNNSSRLYNTLQEVTANRSSLTWFKEFVTATGPGVNKHGVATVGDKQRSVSYRDIPARIDFAGPDKGTDTTARLVLIEASDGHKAYVLDILSAGQLPDLPDK